VQERNKRDDDIGNRGHGDGAHQRRICGGWRLLLRVAW
jgi:hypothetical protein